MSNTIYKTKTFALTSYAYLNDKKYDKISTCPYCGSGSDPVQTALTPASVTNGTILNCSYRCINCDGTFHVSYKKSNQDEKFTPFCVYPNFRNREFSDKIKAVSPRFVKLFNQASKAEYDNNIDLACTGYRNALEVLIKDYAIQVLHEDKNSVIGKKLATVVCDYLPNIDMNNCQDIIRILGNKDTHYETDYENSDFAMFKQYLDISIEMIDVQIKLKNPTINKN